jgi:hypothetical protein
MALRVRQLLDKTREAQWSITTAELDKPDPRYPTDLTKNAGRGSIAIQLKQLTPTLYMDGEGEPKNVTSLDDQIYPGLRLMLLNSAIKLFNDVYTSTEPARWRRCVCDPIYFNTPELEHGQRFCVPVKRRQMNVLRSGYPFLAGGGMNTDDQVNQYGIYKATQMGADKARVDRWSSWVDRMWPRPAGWVERQYPLPASSVLQVQALCPQ